jgi:hypothetical protein
MTFFKIEENDSYKRKEYKTKHYKKQKDFELPSFLVISFQAPGVND